MSAYDPKRTVANHDRLERLFGVRLLEQTFKLAQLIVNTSGDSPFFGCTLQPMQPDVKDDITKWSTGRGKPEISFKRLPLSRSTPWPTLVAKDDKERLKSGSIAGFDPHFNLRGNRETSKLGQQIRVACAADFKFAI